MLNSVKTVLNPEIYESVAPIPPATSKVYLGFKEEIPTFLASASARMRFVETSKPFLTTKFLLIAIGGERQPVKYYYLVG